ATPRRLRNSTGILPVKWRGLPACANSHESHVTLECSFKARAATGGKPVLLHRQAACATSRMKPLAECRLYAFVDTAYLRGRAPDGVAKQLCAGGADLIQLRAKQSSLDEIRRMAQA